MSPRIRDRVRRMRRASGALSRIVLAALFAFAGTMHFVIPASYMRVMPPWVPAHRAMVLVSGACEIAGGLGLLVPRLRRAAGIGLIALLVAVWPANLQMLLNARAAHQPGWAQVLLFLRLPLQIVLIGWVWLASRTTADAPPAETAVDRHA